MVKTRSGKDDTQRLPKSKVEKKHQTKRKRKSRKEKNTPVEPTAEGHSSIALEASQRNRQTAAEQLQRWLSQRFNQQSVASNGKVVHSTDVNVDLKINLLEALPNQKIVFKNGGGKLHIKKAIIHKDGELVTPSPLPEGWKIDHIVTHGAATFRF